LDGPALKKEIAILVSVALGSMAVGFVIVLLVLGPGRSRTLPDPFAEHPPAAHEQPAPVRAPDTAPEPGKKVEQAQPPKPAPAPVEDEASPTPPAAGRLALEVGDPFIWRCWAEGSDDPLEKERCGSLPGIEKMVDDNLGAVETCVIEGAGTSASGKLSLALRLDFAAGTVKAWLGNSTTVQEMDSISACLREAFAAKAVPAIAHDYPRYIVFFTITLA
jgi:hypothetical protein